MMMVEQQQQQQQNGNFISKKKLKKLNRKKLIDELKKREKEVVTKEKKKDRLLPYLKNSLLTEDIIEKIMLKNENTGNGGYFVIPSVLSKEECKDSLDLMWDFIQDISQGEIHSSNTTPTAVWHQRIESHGAGFLFGKLREILADRVFEKLYCTRELHVSKEGFSFEPSSAAGLRELETSEHSHKSIINTTAAVEPDLGLHYIRGAVSLLDNQNLSFNNNFFNVKQGDVILWRSDLKLSSLPSVDNSSRALVYISMTPSCFTSKIDEGKKILAYTTFRTGDYRPDVEDESNWYNSSSLPSHYRPYFRFGAPKVSYRLAELYGLVPYPSSILSVEQKLENIQRAIRQGVCFDLSDEQNPVLNRLSQILSISQKEEQENPPKRGISCNAKTESLMPKSGPLMGQDKYLGGVSSPFGDAIFGVPGHASRVLKVHCCVNGEVEFIGPDFGKDEFKWLRGVEIPAHVFDEENGNSNKYPRGACLALPANANSVLMINPENDEVVTFGDPEIIYKGGWKWHGGNLAPNGFVYAIPANTNRVLKIYPKTQTTTLIGPDFGFDMKQKWFGGLFSSYNNCIYGIPHNHTGVLKINPENDEVTIIGEGELPEGLWKWHGGLITLDGKKIVGFPNNHDQVLFVDVTTDRVYLSDAYEDANRTRPLLKSGRHRKRNDGKYKYLGGALASERFAYLFPCDAERVLRIDLKHDSLKLVGPDLLEGMNKYQNGFVGKDNCVYAIPQRANSVIRIRPPSISSDGDEIYEEEEHIDMLYCGDSQVAFKDKFEGGVLGASDGNIYCIPLRAKAVLKVIVPESSKEEI